MNLQQDSRRQGKRAAALRHEAGQLRHHERDKNRDQGYARQGQERWINQRLLHAVAQIFCLHQMLHQPQQNVRQRAAGFACRDHVRVKRRENSRKLTQCLRKAPAVHQGLMQRLRHLLHARLFEALHQDRQSLVECHSCS